MMYPFMTLDDNTEVVHSEMLPDGRVKVYFEKAGCKRLLPFCCLLSSGRPFGDAPGWPREGLF